MGWNKKSDGTWEKKEEHGCRHNYVVVDVVEGTEPSWSMVPDDNGNMTQYDYDKSVVHITRRCTICGDEYTSTEGS